MTTKNINGNQFMKEKPWERCEVAHNYIHVPSGIILIWTLARPFKKINNIIFFKYIILGSKIILFLVLIHI